jgi:hypothetical protein
MDPHTMSQDFRHQVFSQITFGGPLKIFEKIYRKIFAIQAAPPVPMTPVINRKNVFLLIL